MAEVQPVLVGLAGVVEGKMNAGAHRLIFFRAGLGEGGAGAICLCGVDASFSPASDVSFSPASLSSVLREVKREAPRG